MTTDSVEQYLIQWGAVVRSQYRHINGWDPKSIFYKIVEGTIIIGAKTDHVNEIDYQFIEKVSQAINDHPDPVTIKVINKLYVDNLSFRKCAALMLMKKNQVEKHKRKMIRWLESELVLIDETRTKC